MNAGDRAGWRGDQDDRPLSRLGERQAERLAAAFNSEPIEALFASPAMRARQTLEPLATQSGLRVHELPDLSEERLGEDTSALADRGERALFAIRALYPSGRVVACSHGDLIPALAERLYQSLGATPDHLEHRGQRYQIEMRDRVLRIERRELEDFPI